MTSIDDYLSRMLLRYFRRGSTPALDRPEADEIEDADYLRLHWAFSQPVMELASYLADHLHEAQSSQEYRTRVDDAVIRGRLVAARTVLLRAVTGHPTAVVCEEPVRSFTAGPNYVLIWVLQQAYMILSRARLEFPQDSSYGSRIHAAFVLIANARRLNIIAQASERTVVRARPAANALAQATRSRRPLYRKAAQAYQLLRQVETGDRKDMESLLRDTLISPLENWQKFELLLAFAMAAALGTRLAQPPVLLPILPGSGKPIIRVAQYELHWQARTRHYTPPNREPSEIIVDDILTAYNVRAGYDRPDIVVVNTAIDRVVAVGEAKYLTDDTSPRADAFRAAVDQLVGYARGYYRPEVIRSASLAAVVVLPEYIRTAAVPANVPLAVAMDELLNDRLTGWADRVVIASGALAAPP